MRKVSHSLPQCESPGVILHRTITSSGVDRQLLDYSAVPFGDSVDEAEIAAVPWLGYAHRGDYANDAANRIAKLRVMSRNFVSAAHE